MGLGGWRGGWAGLTEVSEGRVAIFPHPSAAAQQAVGPQPINWFLRKGLSTPPPPPPSTQVYLC